MWRILLTPNLLHLYNLLVVSKCIAKLSYCKAYINSNKLLQPDIIILSQLSMLFNLINLYNIPLCLHKYLVIQIIILYANMKLSNAAQHYHCKLIVKSRPANMQHNIIIVGWLYNNLLELFSNFVKAENNLFRLWCF